MSTGNENLIDLLSSIHHDFGRFSSDVADVVDSYLDKVSDALRQKLSASPWFPDNIRPKTFPISRKLAAKSVPLSFYRRALVWVINHKILTGAIIVTIGGITYHVFKKNMVRKKRKAIRAKDGLRLEVIVIAGQPGEPYTRSISLDLERRGFIVYIVCSTNEEERIVQNEARPDIKPLALDIRNPLNAKASIERFTAYLQSPHAAFPGAKFHCYTMRSLIVIPTTQFPTMPIAKLDLSTLSDLLNTRLLQPIIMIQNFLPLFQNLPFNHAHINADSSSDAKPSILILTPSIISSINPAFHLPEASITSALSSFTSVLEQEVAPLSISVTHLQLGNFDLSGFSPHNRKLTIQSQRAETLRWDEKTRENYGRNYTVSTTSSWGNQSNLRVLNKAVLDAMYNRKSGVIRVGSGSVIYGFIGKWVPRSLISWMMGLRKVDRLSNNVNPTFLGASGEVDHNVTTQLTENKCLYGQKDEETFEDAGVWSLGFESKMVSDDFHP
ncbi:putative duf1776-domain-containing protein [Erysiphe neolycopersici]|uniref:Putative duf1776-domain-containing protein n=1 Tax=Erysiphe neolycopersici TaxID=212602 RepID=A0A420I524_9PEZI|nr:putative duf1776-domain-containing protein [Erysiphe neolycopersici]